MKENRTDSFSKESKSRMNFPKIEIAKMSTLHQESMKISKISENSRDKNIPKLPKISKK